MLTQHKIAGARHNKKTYTHNTQNLYNKNRHTKQCVSGKANPTYNAIK